VVSGAAGAVGQTVGQLAKLKGCRVVGIAGGTAKCEWVVRELGFDACIDYKGGSVKDGLKEHCPQGVDIYFDNVGGEILDTVLTRINRKARIVICGAISQYNNTTAVQGPKNYLSLLVNRARMEGLVVFDYAGALRRSRGRDGRLPEGRPHEEQGRRGARRCGRLPGHAEPAVQWRELRQAGAAEVDAAHHLLHGHASALSCGFALVLGPCAASLSGNMRKLVFMTICADARHQRMQHLAVMPSRVAMRTGLLDAGLGDHVGGLFGASVGTLL
jgi:hypothetical protein